MYTSRVPSEVGIDDRREDMTQQLLFFSSFLFPCSTPWCVRIALLSDDCASRASVCWIEEVDVHQFPQVDCHRPQPCFPRPFRDFLFILHTRTSQHRQDEKLARIKYYPPSTSSLLPRHHMQHAIWKSLSSLFCAHSHILPRIAHSSLLLIHP